MIDVVFVFVEGFFSSKWKTQYVVLHKDSMLLWYKDQGDIEAEGMVLLKVQYYTQLVLFYVCCSRYGTTLN